MYPLLFVHPAAARVRRELCPGNGDVSFHCCFRCLGREKPRKLFKAKKAGAPSSNPGVEHSGNCSTMVPPMKVSFDRRECRWSEWIESMRKDGECTFGILKGRWRILKAGIRVHGTASADAILKTCCAMHNWLLEVDGLDDEWEQGKSSIWQGELGEFEEDDDATQHAFALRRLRTGSSFRNYDLSGMGVANDVRTRSNGQSGMGLHARNSLFVSSFPNLIYEIDSI